MTATLTVDLAGFDGTDLLPTRGDTTKLTFHAQPGVHPVPGVAVHIDPVPLVLTRASGWVGQVDLVAGVQYVVTGLPYPVGARRHQSWLVGPLVDGVTVDLGSVLSYGGTPVSLDQVAALAARIAALESAPGGSGSAGASAYDVAVAAGFVGTVPEWLASLVGAPGAKGDDGIQGPAGPTAVSTDADNRAVLGTDSLTYVPPVSWANVTGKPTDFMPRTHGSTHAADGSDPVMFTAVDITDSTPTGRAVLTAPDPATARATIGAGTSSLALGTTAGTAKEGDYAPAWGDVTGKPETFPPSTHTHPSMDVTDFVEAVQDIVGAMVVAAGGTYDDAAGTIAFPWVAP